MNSGVNLNPSRRDLSLFALGLVIFSGLLGGVVMWRGAALWGVGIFLAIVWLISIVFNRDNRRAQLLGVLIPGLCLAIGGSVKAGADATVVAAVVCVVSVLVAVVIWTVPGVGRSIFVGWSLAAVPIGWAISHLAMMLAYYVVITPLGLIMKLFGYDPMKRRYDPQAPTYWLEHEPSSDRSRYFRQF